ncbi:type IIL restriction-modification enzyme MmeI [Paraburkholderia tropica]|uniref:type IIL restriction-modification enzyme MmeI n=1 Tax=Paraburkholderia tropica TaxID=92647 RepID=UPI002AAF80A7|nr:type IIL restriction-modification enzyme MmeI [Paraburkholderia tropica]
MSKLHEALLRANFRGRDLETFLTRLLFCFFADDTGIFGPDNLFRQLVERTRAFDNQMRALLVQCAELDWSGISPAIFGAMFQGVLEVHTPDEKRQATRRELGAHYTSERNILRVHLAHDADDRAGRPLVPGVRKPGSKRYAQGAPQISGQSVTAWQMTLPVGAIAAVASVGTPPHEWSGRAWPRHPSSGGAAPAGLYGW